MPSKLLKVAGHCPCCGGETLFVGEGGAITCSWVDCPNPAFVHELLSTSETEHIVVFGVEAFTVQHPLREHLDDLFDCKLFEFLKTRLKPESKIGRYRVKPAPRLSGDEELTYEFEELIDEAPDDWDLEDEEADESPTGIRCEGCEKEQRVGDEGWESCEGLDWCLDCFEEDSDD